MSRPFYVPRHAGGKAQRRSELERTFVDYDRAMDVLNAAPGSLSLLALEVELHRYFVATTKQVAA